MGRRRTQLIERRKTLGLSQESLAEAIGAETSTVARWERGETTPQPWHRPRLAEALKIAVEDVGGLLENEAPQTPADERLRLVVQHPGQVDLVAVAHLRQRVYDLDARYVITPSTSLLADAAECLSLAEHLRTGATTSRVQRELRAVEAEAAILMGELVWDASQRRDHAAARAYLDQAVTAARESNDPIVEGWALLRTTIVALYGEENPKVALDLARQTADATRTSHVLAGLAMLHAAEANAMMQQRQDCERALGEGEALFGRMSTTDPATDLLSPTDHSRMAGSCYLFLGDAQRAQRTLETTVRELQGTSKAQAVAIGNLSLAYLRQRKIEEAAATLHLAVDVVERTRGGGGLTVVFAAGRELQPWREVAAVQDVHDRLLNLVAA